MEGERDGIIRSGALIRRARLAAGLTPLALAEQLTAHGYGGVTPAMSLLGRTEKGVCLPSPGLIEAIARCLSIDAALLYEEIGHDDVRRKRARARTYGYTLTPLPWDAA